MNRVTWKERNTKHWVKVEPLCISHANFVENIVSVSVLKHTASQLHYLFDEVKQLNHPTKVKQLTIAAINEPLLMNACDFDHRGKSEILQKEECPSSTPRPLWRNVPGNLLSWTSRFDGTLQNKKSYHGLKEYLAHFLKYHVFELKPSSAGQSV